MSLLWTLNPLCLHIMKLIGGIFIFIFAAVIIGGFIAANYRDSEPVEQNVTAKDEITLFATSSESRSQIDTKPLSPEITEKPQIEDDQPEKIGRLMKKTRDLQNATAKQLDSNALMTAIDFSDLSSLKNFDERLTIIQLYSENNQEALTYYKNKGIVTDIEKALQDEGLTGEPAEVFIEKFLKVHSIELPYLISMRESDAKICEASSMALRLLKDNSTKWSWDDQKSMFIFTDNAVLNKFNTAMEIMSSASAQQQIDRAALYKIKRN